MLDLPRLLQLIDLMAPEQQRTAAAEARGLVHAAAAEALTEEGLSAKERVSARRAVLCGMWTARGVCRYCGCCQAVDGDSPHEEDCDGRVALAAIGRISPRRQGEPDHTLAHIKLWEAARTTAFALDRGDAWEPLAAHLQDLVRELAQERAERLRDTASP